VFGGGRIIRRGFGKGKNYAKRDRVRPLQKGGSVWRGETALIPGPGGKTKRERQYNKNWSQKPGLAKSKAKKFSQSPKLKNKRDHKQMEERVLERLKGDAGYE